MHVAQYVLDLVKLQVSRSDQFGGAGEVVGDCDGQDLNDHHYFYFLL